MKTAQITACLDEVNFALLNGRIRKGVALKLFALLLEMRETEKARQEVLREVRECGLYNRRVSQTLYRKVKAITEDL